MKILKYLLYAILFLVLLVIVLGLVGPKSYNINRSAVIPGTPDQVWPYVSTLEKMQIWSPWATLDPNMAVTYEGTDGTVGASVSWKGNRDVGEGKQTLTKLEPNRLVESELHFLKPMEGKSMHYTQLKDTTGGTLVTWGMKGDNNFISRAMCAVMPFEKMMGRDFEKGLTMLTEVMAADPSAAGLRVETGDFPAARYLGVRGTMSFDKIDSFYTQNLPAVFEALTKAGATMASAPTGLYFEWDETTNMTTMAAAIAFAGDLKAPAGMEIIEVPASRMARIDYYGSYDDLGNAHTEMDKYFMANNLEQTPPVIEEYVTDPGEEPDQSRWLTRITYLIK